MGWQKYRRGKSDVPTVAAPASAFTAEVTADKMAGRSARSIFLPNAFRLAQQSVFIAPF
jgi:hypothetical protein